MNAGGDRYKEEWAARVEALHPEEVARKYIDVYASDIGYSDDHAWHWDAATARMIIKRDHDAIVSRCADILRRGDLLHGGASYEISPRQLRICAVDADAVELHAMPLSREQSRRFAPLRDPDRRSSRRKTAVLHQLNHEIDDLVRRWTGSGAESSFWEYHFSNAYALADLHAERIERTLRECCPDPWLHSVAGALAFTLRSADIVSSTTLHEDLALTRPRVPRFPLVSKAYYALFRQRPDFADLVLAFPGLLIVPDAFRMSKLTEVPAGDIDGALECLRAHLPAWAQPLPLDRLKHYVCTMPTGVIIAGGGWRHTEDETTGVRIDYTGHVCMWPRQRVFDAHAAHRSLSDAEAGTLPASPREWLTRFPPPAAAPRGAPEPATLSPEDHDRIFRKAILPDHNLG